MTRQQNNEIKDLCQLIAKEQDHQKFSELVKQLSRRLDAKDFEAKARRRTPNKESSGPFCPRQRTPDAVVIPERLRSQPLPGTASDP
jgi:hypothetical protein